MLPALYRSINLNRFGDLSMHCMHSGDRIFSCLYAMSQPSGRDRFGRRRRACWAGGGRGMPLPPDAGLSTSGADQLTTPSPAGRDA